MFRLGTRKSKLAVTQSESIRAALALHSVDVELVYIESEGDQNRSQPLYEIETATPGLFTKHLEQALLDKRIDLAVHSLKDLPTQQPAPLFVAATPLRENTQDILLVRPDAFDPTRDLSLKAQARVGTSSLRREAQLLFKRNDLRIEPIRGNVPTRVDRVREGRIDAVVLAAAGLSRLALDLTGVHAVPLTDREFVPAPAQGALGIEARQDGPPALLAALNKLHHAPTGRAVTLERRILRELEGGCTLPFGVLAETEGAMGLKVRAFLGLEGGKKDEKVRNWLGFRYFDISGEDDETLVAQTVKHFRDWQDKEIGHTRRQKK